jgi:hypothetical protein
MKKVWKKGARLRSILGTKIGFFFGIFLAPISDHFLSNFWAHFGAQNLPKMSQNEFQKPSQGATRAKKNDFENHRFVLFFAALWEHRPSQESPKTARKPPKMPSKAQQEPCKKKSTF